MRLNEIYIIIGHENDQKGRVAKSQAEVGELNEIEAGLLRKGREAEAARQNNGGRRRSRQRTKRKNLRNKRRNRKTRKSRKNRKNGKATRKGTRKTRRNGKTRRNKNSRRKAKRTRQNKQRLNRAGQGRQLAADCYGALQNASKKYIQYSNQLRKLKRVKGWAKVMDNKKTSSDSTFNDAKDSINNATGSGKTCKGSSITGDAMKNQEKLNNCSKSAKAKCDKGQISGLNSSLLDTCQPKLEKWTKKYQVFLSISLSSYNLTALPCHNVVQTVESILCLNPERLICRVKFSKLLRKTF